MELPTPKLNISCNLGQDKGQSLLATVHMRNHTGVAEVEEVKLQAKLGSDPIGQFMVCLLKYSVYPGREAQALKYMQEGFDETILRELMSPLQFITCKNQCEETENCLYSEPGAICVRYKFPIEQDDQILKGIEAAQKMNKFQMELQLKGFVSHSLKNRTNVKVDYSYFNLTANEMPDPNILNNFLFGSGFLPEEIQQDPFYSTATKTRKLHLALKLKSFRQMNKYFEKMEEAAGTSTKKKQKEDFKYVAPGLFREKVEGFVFLQDDVAVSGEMTHQGEDILLRLIKVYFKAARKSFDL